VCLDGERFLVSPRRRGLGAQPARGPSIAAAPAAGHSERLVADEVEAAPAGSVLRHYVKQVPITAPFFDAGRDAPVEDFVAEAPRHPMLCRWSTRRMH